MLKRTSIVSKMWIVFCLQICSFKLNATDINDFNKLYNSNQFKEAVEVIKSIDNNLMKDDLKAYYLGQCYFHLSEYELAITNFEMALKKENNMTDLYYVYGQSLYAVNRLKEARYAFLRSAARKYNYTASVYYVAYISELLEDYTTAKYNYKNLIKDSQTDKKILQVSLYKYSRILLMMMRQEEKTLIRLEKNLVDYIPRYILPLLKRALSVDEQSELANEIRELIQVLQNEFNLDPNVMKNGRRIYPGRPYVNFSERIKYDDNVALTKNNSTYFESEGYARYDFIHRKKWIISPDVKITYDKYKKQKNPDVFVNDAITLNGDLRNKFEHKINTWPASFILDFEFSNRYKDWDKKHSYKKYYQNTSFVAGEQFRFFQSGETAFRITRSHYTDITNTINSNTTSLTLDQYTYLKDGQHLLITTFDRSAFDYFDNDAINVNTYLLRFYYYIFEIFPTYTLQLGLATTLTDTLKQKSTRGLELTINPSIDFSKAITERLRLGINYSYIENTSKLDSYYYHRQILGSELSYTF